MLVKISCSRDEVPAYEGYRAISDFGAQGFLEFQDGSVSPLYVRRSPNFDD